MLIKNKIKAPVLTNASVVLTQDSYTYTGGKITPSFKVMDGTLELQEGVDYRIKSITNAVNVGTATITVEGLGTYYSGEASGKPVSNELNIDSVFNKKDLCRTGISRSLSLTARFPACTGTAGIWSIGNADRFGRLEQERSTKILLRHCDGTNQYTEHLPYRLGVDNRMIGVGPIYGIRRAYIYIENVDRVPDMTDQEKAIGKAEAKVIIAYHYSQMLRYYGGMPWIDHAYTAEDEMKFHV